MPAQITYESPVFLPTLERAKKLVPQAFLPCYDWFTNNAGEKIPRLPHNMSPKPVDPHSAQQGLRHLHSRRYPSRI